MIVKNEEQWVWYAINSVINHLHKLIIFDTGSIDKTVSIIKSINSKKIIFTQKSKVNPAQLVDLRNEQIKRTRTDWFLLVDGDEIWPKITIDELVKKVNQASRYISGIVVPVHVPLGDLFHDLDESAGKYRILGKMGHYNLRAYKIKFGYDWQGIYPAEAYTNRSNTAIQDQSDQLVLLKNKYWHMTHLPRSSNDDHHKRKYEIGKKYSGLLPEVLYQERTEIVGSPWVNYSILEQILACLSTPFIKLKRQVYG